MTPKMLGKQRQKRNQLKLQRKEKMKRLNSIRKSRNTIMPPLLLKQLEECSQKKAKVSQKSIMNNNGKKLEIISLTHPKKQVYYNCYVVKFEIKKSYSKMFNVMAEIASSATSEDF